MLLCVNLNCLNRLWPSVVHEMSLARTTSSIATSAGKGSKVNMVLNVHRAYWGRGEGGNWVWRWGERQIIIIPIATLSPPE